MLGSGQQNLKLIEQVLEVSVHLRGNTLSVQGPDDETVDLTEDLLRQLFDLARADFALYPADVKRCIGLLRKDPRTKLKRIFQDRVLVTSSKRSITPKGLAQKAYVDAMRSCDMVFAIGPAGTGKTYLAMAMAVAALAAKAKKRIILTRPAVEAGEKLGFLPGDLVEKVNPYLRPLYDALHDMMDFRKVQRLMEQGSIEVAPLAFMRGRTLNDAFVVLDEAQNTTREQMKMFLTRLGFHSKAVITGDITQMDLPEGQRSGLVEAMEILEGIEGIAFNYFTEVDVVRHPLVQSIIRAYEAFEKKV